MKTRTKKLLGVVGIVATLGILTSCNSFCSSYDSASYRYQHDPINTFFFSDLESAKKYAYKSVLSTNKEAKEYYLDSNGQTKLSIDNADQLKVKVLVDGKNEDKSAIVRADELFTFEGESTYFTKINESLKNTYALRSGTVTSYYALQPKEGEEVKYNSVFTTFSKNGFVRKIENEASKQLTYAPASSYWNNLDEKVISKMIKQAEEDKYFEKFAEGGELKDKTPKSLFELFYGYTTDTYNDYLAKKTDAKADILKAGGEYTIGDKKEVILGRNNSLFANFGFVKYVEKYEIEASNGVYWKDMEKWNDEIRKENIALGDNYVMSSDFYKTYKAAMDQDAAQLRTCITIDNGFYGHYGNDDINNSIKLTSKASWGDAWKHGFLEGLFVYPISYMVEFFSHAFGMNGWGQIGAVLLVTIIVRGLFMLVTFRSTLSQQKMQTLQPEIAKLQQKYPNSDTNQYEKQRLAQAQMALYKKHKIHPFSSLLVILIQFPVFISVWNGFSGSASLTTDAVLGLRLSDTIWSSLTNVAGWPNLAGWWTALVLILLMSAGQIVSMQLPRWLQKKQVKEISRTHKNPAESAQQKQMKWVSWIMTIFIIIMGFTLPAAMGVYWFAGALFSMIQSTIMHFIMLKRTRGGKRPALASGKQVKKEKHVKEKKVKTEPIEAEIVDKDNKAKENKKNK